MGSDKCDGLAELELMLGGERLERAVRGCALAHGLGGDARAVGARLAAPGPGIAGFLGDHSRVELRLRAPGRADLIVRLFVKTVPRDNPDKEQFLDEGNFFRREALVYSLLESEGCEGAEAWRPHAFVCDERAVVMADLAAAGCAPRPGRALLDAPHCRLAAQALARWHAAVCALEEARGPDYCLLDEHADVLAETSFCPGDWLTAAARLTAAVLREFGGAVAGAGAGPELDGALQRGFERACATLRHEPGALNVLLHRDAWVNNLLFEYGPGGAPRRALLIDYQCVRHAPPAFDVMLLLYLTTDAQFRRAHEQEVLDAYWTAWERAGAGGARAARLRYDRGAYRRRCADARMFALAAASCICPFVLMGEEAARCFVRPDTFRGLMFADRSGPVLAHARQNAHYRYRLVELAEEFVQRYITDEDLEKNVLT